MIRILRENSVDAPAAPDAIRVGPGDPAAVAVQSALAGGLYWLRANEPAARSGDPTGVHHLRTSTRRLRTALGLFGGLIEPAQAAALSADLKWLAGVLGEVRDLDVLTARFRSAAEDDGSGWGEAFTPLFTSLGERHAVASEALREALRGDRFEGLKARLTGSADGHALTEASREPCRTALPAMVFGIWKALRRAGRALSPDDLDDRFHEVRKRAKRARYAAEAVIDALDSGPAADASRFVRRVRAVQDVLGAHQDAVIAASEVRAAAGSRPHLGPFNFAAGQLLERERRAAEDARAGFFHVWADLDRKRVVRWLKP